MKAHVKPHNGAPTLFLDGKPVYANLQWIGGFTLADPKSVELTQVAIRAFAKAGVHIYTLDGLFNDWSGPREGSDLTWDFSENGPRLQKAVDADPEALFNLRLMFETRHLLDNWWNKQHPDEVEVMSQGDSKSASYASKVWHQDVKDLLTALVAHLREIGMYDRVIGYQMCTGTCGEWIKSWSCMELPNGDFSAPMQVYFRHWLTQRYGTDAALQAAWGNPEVTLATAGVPTSDEQDTTSHYFFRDPNRERNVIDFYEAYAELCADTLLDFCHTIKELTNGDKLTGAFFGYIMELSWNDTFFTDGFMGSGPQGLASSEVSTVQRSGHLGLAKALRSPDIDFFVSPYTYGFRGLGGDGLAMQPSESLRVHNKLYWFEEDTLMHNNLDPRKRMHPVKHSVAIYKRNFAEVLTHAQGITWLENDYFAEDPSIVDEFHNLQARFHTIGNWAVQFDRQPSAEVAVFLDDESYMYEANRNHLSLPMIWHQRLMNLNRFGAPHDLYLLNDLLEGRLPEYKLYIFLNVFHLNDARRAALKQQLRRDGKTALFLYAPGYLNEDDTANPFGIEHMTDLTGFKFGRGLSYWTPQMHVTEFDHPITQCVSQELFWGTTRSLAPIFFLEDDDATVLGQVIGSLGRVQPGLGVKTFNAGTPEAWNSVYVATPNVPSPVLRGIARFAGVHLYNEDGDVLYATPRFVSAHSVKGGPRTFKLPQPAEVVYDLYNRKLLGQDTAEFCTQLPPASTTLFYTGPAAALRELEGEAEGVSRMSQEIVVTGGSGRLGKIVTAHVLEQGYRVRSLDRVGRPAAAPAEGVTFVDVEMNDLAKLTEAIKGADAVIHLAAFPGPWGQPPGVVYSNNTTINYNVLYATSELGINKVALASSVNAYGGLGSKTGHFDYFPVDENHPTYNEDDYSLSKWVGEAQADSYARRSPDMTISSLRFHGLPDAPPVLESVLHPREHGAARNLWGWTLISEAARACLLAVQADFKGHERFNIMAPTTTSTYTTAELAAHAYPDLPFRKELPGHTSFFDCSKAARLLGWVHASA